jgi:phenylpropionate dioxygenase-like ring-hydroxylating dioxygenase large terminal subunit
LPAATEELLGALAENADRDFTSAQSPPPAIYHDAGIFRLELERIFRREWICLGRLAEIPQPGDYVCRDITESPVFVVRQRDHSVKAFANICAHRAAQLLTDSGHATRISCPYHSWTYELDGRLVGAPFMQDTPGFSIGAHRLKELACDTWEGFIYVNLDPDARPISSRLDILSGMIGDYRIRDYVPVFSQTETWETNWKCLVENFMDAYHIHKVHKNSFGKYGSFEEQTHLFDGEDTYSYLYVQEDDGPDSNQAHADNTWLKGAKRNRTYVINVFPSHVMQLQPDMLWYLSILPHGTEQVKIRWAVSVPGEFLDAGKAGQAHIDDEMSLLHQVNSEDKAIVENLSKTTRSPDAGRGPLSYLERNAWQFGRYLARKLVE